jgi:hypothetical protein
MRQFMMMSAAFAVLSLAPGQTFAQAPGGHEGGAPGGREGGAAGAERGGAPGGEAPRGGGEGGRMQAAPSGGPAGQGGAPRSQGPQGGPRGQAEQRPAGRGPADHGPAERGAGQQGAGERDAGERGAGERGGPRGGHPAINGEQRTRIRSEFRSAHGGEVLHNPGFATRIGGRIPDRFRYYPLPPDILEFLPEYRGYDYIEVDDAILIVDPRTREIVYVID